MLYPNLLSPRLPCCRHGKPAVALLPPRSFLWRVISSASHDLEYDKEVIELLGSLKLLSEARETVVVKVFAIQDPHVASHQL